MIELVLVLSMVLGIGMSPVTVDAPVIEPVPVAPIVQEVTQEVQKPVEPVVIEWVGGQATAYYNGKDAMNGETGITASGYPLDNGIWYNGYRILASDKSIPLGTLVEITLEEGNIITGIVLDRGGMITENKFDIVFGSRKECFKFGRQAIKYRIVGKVEL